MEGIKRSLNVKYVNRKLNVSILSISYYRRLMFHLFHFKMKMINNRQCIPITQRHSTVFYLFSFHPAYAINYSSCSCTRFHVSFPSIFLFSPPPSLPSSPRNQFYRLESWSSLQETTHSRGI